VVDARGDPQTAIATASVTRLGARLTRRNDPAIPPRQARMSGLTPNRSTRIPPGSAPTPNSPYPRVTTSPRTAAVVENSLTHTVNKIGIESS